MKATRHNGRVGKHGVYDAKHNDRRFDVENSEHIDAERTKYNVYKVKVHFKENAKETLEDKIIKLMVQDLRAS